MVFQTTVKISGNHCRQYLAATSVNILSFVVGCGLGWSSPALAQLQDEHSFLPVTVQESSWLGSLLPLGAVFGPLTSVCFSDRFGRKPVLLAISVPFFVSWIVKAVASSVLVLYAVRFIIGLCTGGMMCVVPVYLGEIADDAVRGSLGTFLALFSSMGILFHYVVGPFIPYNWLCFATSAFPVLFFMTFFLMPESPHFLVAKGNIQKARENLKWLRAKKYDAEVDQELNSIQEQIQRSQKNEESLKNLLVHPTRKALLISLSLMAFQQLSGVNAVLFYGEIFFGKIGSTLSPAVSTIIMGLVNLSAAVSAPFIADRFKRKTLLMTSGVGAAINLFILGLFFQLDSKGVDVADFSPICLAASLIFLVFIAIGLGPLPWSITSEIFSPGVRSAAVSIATSFVWFVSFLITRFFADLEESIGMAATFWMFSGFCFLAALSVFFFVPETKGKSFQEIQNLLGSI